MFFIFRISERKDFSTLCSSSFLDLNEITPARRQTNTTEMDNPRTWLATSILELTISKENHGRILRCVAVHESYSTKSSSVEVRLDVMCKFTFVFI